MNRDVQRQRLGAAAEATASFRRALVEQNADGILDFAAQITGVIGSGGKVLLLGNGPLAAVASLMAGAMVVRFSREQQRAPLPAIALCADPAVMTLAADESGYEYLFNRQVEALGHKGDLIICFSVSGNTPNLIRAAATARELGLISSAFVGNATGKLTSSVDRALVVPASDPQRVVEEQLFLAHLILEQIEHDLFA